MKRLFNFLIIFIFIFSLFIPDVFAEDTDVKKKVLICDGGPVSKGDQCGSLMYVNYRTYLTFGTGRGYLNEKNVIFSNNSDIGDYKQLSLYRNYTYQKYLDDGTSKDVYAPTYIYSFGVYDNDSYKNSIDYNFEKDKIYTIEYRFSSGSTADWDISKKPWDCFSTGMYYFEVKRTDNKLSPVVKKYVYDGIHDIDDSPFKTIRFGIVEVEPNLVYNNNYVLYIEFVPKFDINSLQFRFGNEEDSKSVPLLTSNLESFKYPDDTFGKFTTLSFEGNSVYEVSDFLYSPSGINTQVGCYGSLSKDESDFDDSDDYKDCDLTDIVCHLNNFKIMVGNFFNFIKNAFLSIFDFFGNLISSIINAFKDLFSFLFVPSDDFISSKVNELDSDLKSELGILYFPFSLLQSVLNRFINYEDTYHVMRIPSISIPFFGKLTDSTTFDIKAFFNNEQIKPIYDIYIMCVWGICSVLLVKLCYSKLKAFLGGLV